MQQNNGKVPSVKWFGLVFSFIITICGAVIVAVSLRLLFDPTFAYLLNQNGLYIGAQILAGAGAVIFISGIIGCIAFLAHSYCLLSTFIGLMVVLAVLEVTGGVFVYAQLPNIHEKVHFNIYRAVMRHYGHDNTNTTYMNLIQQEWKCCGSNSYTSWSDSEYAKVHNPLTTHLSTNTFIVPKSCCIEQKSDECDKFNFEGIRGNEQPGLIGNVIYQEGCGPKLVRAINTYSQYVFGIGSGIVLIEIVSVILASCFLYFLRSRTSDGLFGKKGADYYGQGSTASDAMLGSQGRYRSPPPVHDLPSPYHLTQSDLLPHHSAASSKISTPSLVASRTSLNLEQAAPSPVMINAVSSLV